MLKIKRNKLKMTQTDVAVKIGVSLTTYQMWERGGMYPSEENRLKLQKILKLNDEEVKKLIRK